MTAIARTAHRAARSGRRTMRVSAAALVCLALIACPPFARVAAATTTVTTYTYNPDGELTAVTTQVDQGAATTTYLTWDNFVPDATDASTGEVLQGDGRLLGTGSPPGTSNLSEHFTFDTRDRLLSYSGPAGSETFAYYASSMMASATASADALRFYYDQRTNPKVTNVQQAAPDLWSAYLGRVRYLNDGSEEVLLAPRKKDNACSYDPAGETLQSYVYDAYGASTLNPPAEGTYDLRQNPFRFAGEYRDPIWGGYYLRARWYHPQYTVFLSRDPLNTLSRYGYTRGNPVMRVDPSGLKFNYMRDVGDPLGGFLRAANQGVLGHIVRLVFAPLLAPLQIIANPIAFWHAVKTDQNGIDAFIIVGAATEIAGGLLDSSFAAGGTSYLKRFLSRAAADAVLGLSQSTVVAARRGFRNFDWNTFVQGAEYTASIIFWRGVIGVNIRQARSPLLAGALAQAPPAAGLVDALDEDPIERLGLYRDNNNNLLSEAADGELQADELDREQIQREDQERQVEDDLDLDESRLGKEQAQQRFRSEQEEKDAYQRQLRAQPRKLRGVEAGSFRPPEDSLVQESGNQAQFNANSILTELDE